MSTNACSPAPQDLQQSPLHTPTTGSPPKCTITHAPSCPPCHYPPQRAEVCDGASPTRVRGKQYEMAQDGTDSELDGLFNISISESEEGEGGGGTDKSHGIASSSRKSREHRTGQSEDAFRAVRSGYRAKVENGEIWKSVGVPLGSRRVPKHEAQELLHAVEELYFYRRLDEAVSLVGRVFGGEGGGDGLDADVRGLLRTYERKCNEKLVAR